MRISGSVPVYPTEDRGKVREAVRSVFEDASVSESGNRMVFESGDASAFIKSLTDQKIRDTARSIIVPSSDESVSEFYLNKQAALCGKVNFTEGDSTLGDIHVRISEGVEEILQAIGTD